MSDEATADTPEIPPPEEAPVRLVPLSDIDAFATIRIGSIVDEAALLCSQFIEPTNRDKSRAAFVKICMEHFDDIADQYESEKYIAAAMRTAAIRRRADQMARIKKAAEENSPARDKPEE